MEAGNMGRPAIAADPDYLPELSLLTISDRFTAGHRPLTTMYDTSAATALAARLAATVWAAYPDFTPETVRGLLVHSAEWIPAMLARATGADGNIITQNLLRIFGYGTPNSERLFYSASNVLTLIAQSSIQPFFDDDGQIKNRDMNLHDLPWPADALGLCLSIRQ